ncbi:6479_t:CDS:2 [Diversispora eburnea]|uniref:chitin synthase n=1 Tax=Diversispora eburnea TaxID=1213867 RepID=A0A9N8V4K9_9GLOM|nr:6479_t:CDS:2 [Diversispora eburnea]
MDASYAPPARGNTLSRNKTLSRPERYQAATPLLTGKKERKPLDPWVIFSRIVTFWAPNVILSKFGFHDKQSQQAWREKVTLCFLAFLMGLLVVFLTVGLRPLLCPDSQQNSYLYLNYGETAGFLGILGWQFNATATNNTELQKLITSTEKSGQDITYLFKRSNSDIPGCLDSSIQNFAAVTLPLCNDTSSNSTCPLDYLNDITTIEKDYNIKNSSKLVGYDWEELWNLTNYLVFDGVVLNFDPYIKAYPNPLNDTNDMVDSIIRDALNTDHPEGGKDATRLFFGHKNTKQAVLKCLTQKYYAGHISKQTIGCFTSDLFNLIMLVTILSIIIVRFLMACIFDWFISHQLARKPKTTKKNVISPQVIAAGQSRHQAAPWAHQSDSGSAIKTINMNEIGNDLFTVLLVTCYSEGESGLRMTCESMAATTYPDDRKLLFLICDGNITGHGEKLSTPEIAISLIKLDENFLDPQPQSYIAVAAGSKRHNMAKVYCGHFHRRVPTILVSKCGTPEEQKKPKAGNRGKRDSQLILMNFFKSVTYNDRMTALDYDLFKKVTHLMNCTPDYFEIVLMVLYPDSLRLLINCMCNDELIMGLCGETKIANKRDSWVTGIQVFEYYISHHLGKGFESVFGGVTCLPGCFCMYRLKARKGDNDWVPIITKPEIVDEYSQNDVVTLHQKNLLLLGEDRFLTTLMLRNFPNRKMTFCPRAICKTVVPDEFNVLLSQRRRWINSTIHNLMELVLVRNLCGTFCFSMQFVIFMELCGTIVLPVAILLTFWLIIASIMNPPSDFSEATPLMMLAAVLGLPAILILITTRKLIYIAWIKVEGEGKGDDHGKKEGEFDSSKVPCKRWVDWERHRIRKNKRQNKQLASHLTHQSTYDDDEKTGLLPSTYEGSASIASDIGQEEYYDYNAPPETSATYPPQQYDQYQSVQFEDVGFTRDIAKLINLTSSFST